jgi:hypothetical protein
LNGEHALTFVKPGPALAAQNDDMAMLCAITVASQWSDDTSPAPHAAADAKHVHEVPPACTQQTPLPSVHEEGPPSPFGSQVQVSPAALVSHDACLGMARQMQLEPPVDG